MLWSIYYFAIITNSQTVQSNRSTSTDVNVIMQKLNRLIRKNAQMELSIPAAWALQVGHI